MFDRLFVKEDETILIEKAKTNQHDFARVYDRFVDVVYRFVRRRVDNEHDVHDIVSETFMAVAARIKDYETEREQKFTTRLLSIANYKILDHLRTTYRAPESISLEEYHATDDTDIITTLTNRQQIAEIIAYVRTLPDRQSTIFQLRYVEGYKNKEIAEICDIDEKTVSSSLGHVRKKIADKLQKK